MVKQAGRILRAALGLGVAIALMVVVSQISFFGLKLEGGAFFLSPVIGLAAAYQVRRIVPDLTWRELLAALPLTPLFAALISWLPCLALKRGFNLEEACLCSAAASVGVFLLPLLDNDLRQKEPEFAVSRKTTGWVAVSILVAALLNAFLVPVLNPRQSSQSGYNAAAMAIIALFVVFAGWIAALAGAQKRGAQMMAWGSLVAAAAVAIFANSNVSF